MALPALDAILHQCPCGLARQTHLPLLDIAPKQRLPADSHPSHRQGEAVGRHPTMTSRVALRITVTKKLPLAEVRPEELIPSSVFGMPTDVVEDALPG